MNHIVTLFLAVSVPAGYVAVSKVKKDNEIRRISAEELAESRRTLSDLKGIEREGERAKLPKGIQVLPVSR